MTNMKKALVVCAVFVICAVSLPAQEQKVFEYREPFGRFSLSINNETVSSAKKYFFTLSYAGEDYQLYRSITLNIDGTNHWILFAHITQDWTGVSTETYKTKYLDDATIAALRRANSVIFTIDSVAKRRDDTETLPNEAVAQIKQYLR